MATKVVIDEEDIVGFYLIIRAHIYGYYSILKGKIFISCF